MRARSRLLVGALVAVLAAPAVALAAGAPPVPGWMERMMGQASPAMHQQMEQMISGPDSTEMHGMMGGR